MPEFRNIEFGPFSAIPGVRESRRIVCDARVTDAVVAAGGAFPDGLFRVTQGIDIHRRDDADPQIIVRHVPPYQIPYRALLPTGVENLLVAGRCIGGDHEPLASYRIMADCMAMGEAAAIAVKMALENDCAPRGISHDALIGEMRARGYEA